MSVSGSRGDIGRRLGEVRITPHYRTSSGPFRAKADFASVGYDSFTPHRSSTCAGLSSSSSAAGANEGSLKQGPTRGSAGEVTARLRGTALVHTRASGWQ